MQERPTWKINDIFYSLQGEGSLAGLPMIFIRLAGCNIQCTFCDQKDAWKKGQEMTWEDIYDKIVDFPCRNICITGGEPFLQDLSRLTTLLKGYFISIETNGTIYQETNANLIVISPKTFVHSDFLRRDIPIEFKYVIVDETSFKNVFWDRFNPERFSPVYLQPVDNNFSAIQLCIEKILERGGDNWKLSLQIHKMIDIK